MKNTESINNSPLDITVIIDRSGSMAEIRDDAIGAFNTFLADRKQSDPDALMTIVLFDDNYELLANGIPVKDMYPFNRETFVPRGSTALFDAVGRTVGAIQSRKHDDKAILIAILTDGQENSSTEWSGELIQTLIGDLERQGWDFYYLSASLNAFTDGERLGIASAKNIQFKKELINEAYSQLDQAILLKKGFLSKKQSEDKEDSMYR